MKINHLKTLAATLKGLANSLDKAAQGLEGQLSSKSPVKKKNAKAKAPKSSKTPTKKEVILQTIRRARKDLDIAALKKRTGYDTRTINNAVYRLKKEKQIQSPSKGVYSKV
jgi:hypothetical protein